MLKGISPRQAAVFGVYLHGSAADIKVAQTSYQALIASAVVDGIGAAYLELFKVVEPSLPLDSQAN